MKYLVLTFFIFTFAQAQSTDLRDITSRLSFQSIAPAVDQCLDEGLLQQCALDLCGNPARVPSLSGFEEPSTTDSSAVPLPLAMQTRLKALVASTLERNQKRLQLLREEVEKRDLSDYSVRSEETWGNYATSVYEKYFSPHVDISKPLAQRVRFTSRDVNPAIKAGLNNYLDELSKLIAKDPLNMTLGSLRNEMLTPEEIKSSAVEKINGFLSLNDTNPRAKTKLQKLKEKALSYSSTEAVLLIPELDSALAEFQLLKPAITCTKQACRSGIKVQDKEQAKMLLKNLETSSKNPRLFDQAFATCASTMKVPADKNVQIEKFRKKIPALLNQFIEKGMRGSSLEVKNSFRKHFNEQIIQDFGYKEIDNIKLIDKFEERRAQAPLIDREDNLIDTLEDFNSAGPMSGVTPCESNFSRVYSDAYSSPAHDRKEGKILVSEFSCTHQLYGEQIFLHELAHALSDAFKRGAIIQDSSGGYQRLRECAISNHPTSRLPISKLSRPGDNLYTEEDTADLIAFKAAPEGIIFSCSLLKKTPNNQGFTDLALKSNPADSHSPNLLRVIREVLHKGRTLSPVCKQLIDSNTENLRFERCQ